LGFDNQSPRFIGLGATKNYEKSLKRCMGKDNNPSLSPWIYNLATIKSFLVFTAANYGFKMMDNGSFFVLRK